MKNFIFKLILISIISTPVFAGNMYSGVCYSDVSVAADAEISSPPHPFGGTIGLYGAVSYDLIDYRTVLMTYNFYKTEKGVQTVSKVVLHRRYMECNYQ